MKTLAAAVLACVASASFAASDTDPARLRSENEKASADYKLALAKCGELSRQPKAICKEQANLARAHAQADAVAQYNDSPKTRLKARNTIAEADYDLSKARCADMSGADHDNCVSNAKAVRTAALADAKADRAVAVATGRDGEITLADKARDAAATVAAKTEKAADALTSSTASAANKTGAVVADSVITTKVKADIFKEPELKSMAIHVETDKGVVMLSGFVATPADAAKAVQLAKSVSGVTEVKSAIKVK